MKNKIEIKKEDIIILPYNKRLTILGINKKLLKELPDITEQEVGGEYLSNIWGSNGNSGPFKELKEYRFRYIDTLNLPSLLATDCHIKS